jgi:hypothetical protein
MPRKQRRIRLKFNVRLSEYCNVVALRLTPPGACLDQAIALRDLEKLSRACTPPALSWVSDYFERLNNALNHRT